MSDVVRITPLNHSYIRVDTDPGIAREISEHFTFSVPGFKFTPAHRLGGWDGNKSLFSEYKPVMYRGLLGELQKFLTRKKYDIEIHPDLIPRGFFEYAKKREWLDRWALDSVASPDHVPRTYQLDAFYEQMVVERALLLSPTASGKSLIIYLAAKFRSEETNKPILIIVPRKNLVTQLEGDFADYSCGEACCFTIQGGVDKSAMEGDYVISTYHSVMNMSDEWINQFGAIIVDEAHGADAKVISGIMEKAVDVKYRLGFTGTLDGTKVHKMVLTGLFGKVITVTTTRERIDAGDMSDAHITMVGLCYPDADRQKLKKFKQVKRNDKLVWKKAEYKDEIDFIIKHPVRRKFVAGFVSQLKGNTLILFNRNDDYGLPLFDMIKAIIPERSHLVYGGTDNEDREQVRTIMANGKDEIVLASMGTFSVGTNIPSIRNIVFTYPMKGRIQLLQSLGRGLRKSEGKSILKVYDLVDDFRCSGYENYAWRHMGERVKEYDLIGFERTWVDVQF